MSLIKSNKSSNNGQPERSKVWQGANEKSESKQQNNLKSGKLQVTRSQSVSLFATYSVEVAGASEPIKKRSKAKKGHSRITFDKYWLTNGYYKWLWLRQPIPRVFFSCSFDRYVLFVSSSKRKLAISDDSGYCSQKTNLYLARKFDARIVCVNRNCTGTSCTCINNQLTQNRIWKWETI